MDARGESGSASLKGLGRGWDKSDDGWSDDGWSDEGFDLDKPLRSKFSVKILRGLNR